MKSKFKVKVLIFALAFALSLGTFVDSFAVENQNVDGQQGTSVAEEQAANDNQEITLEPIIDPVFDSDTDNSEENTTEEKIKELKSKEFINAGSSLKSKPAALQTVTPSSGGLGYTIQETFPDEKFAQFIAGKISGGNVNAVLTQANVTGITQIYAPRYGIEDITGIEVFSNLESVLLNNNNLVSLPEGICSLTKLKTIYIPYNKITSLPENMGNLINLTQLNLESNKLADLPNSLFKLGSLTSMYLNNNQIQSVSEDIGKLSGLRSLRLGSNQITSLPESIGSLSKLQELLIGNNQLRSLPESIGNLTLLTRLDADVNQLMSMPESIGNLSSLEVLILSKNQLISVPESIGDLSSLRQLYLDYNQLTRIPESIGKLSALTRLYLGDNQLTSLPESWSGLSSLKYSTVDFTLQNNLLPTNYKIRLKELFGITVQDQSQNQLCMKKDAVLIYDINNYSDYDKIIQENFLVTLVDIERDGLRIPLSLEHKLIIENYVDEDGNQVDISEYIQNGIVIKEGSVFIQVRASGVGVFPNNSDHALTADKIQFNFKKAKSSYNLKFDLNGCTDIIPTTQILFEGEKGKAPAEPKREGYTFKGWNISQDGSGTTWNFTTDTMPASDVTLYAQWTKNTYIVNFETGGGTPKPDSQTLSYGDLVVLPNTVEKEGYTFEGWYTKANGEGTKWNFDNNKVVKDTTLYAKWESKDKPTPPKPNPNPKPEPDNNTKTGDQAGFIIGAFALVLISLAYIIATRSSKRKKEQ